MDTAKKCIEYLKRYDIGRGNFYALDKAQKWKEKLARIKTPENAPRLVDLIEVEVRNGKKYNQQLLFYLFDLLLFLLYLLLFYCNFRTKS